MAKKLKFTVTADDIARGLRGMCGSCPIALAVRRRFPGSTVWVDSSGISFAGHLGHIFLIPPLARKFISDFDAGYADRPFTFEAELI